jgi:hypothetical protein
MTEHFDGPHSKLKRADKHIDEFKAVVDNFVSGYPYRVIAQENTNPALLTWVAKVTEDVPSNLACIIGDAIHNLQTALDLLACAIVRKRNLSLGGVRFPSADDGVSFEATLENGLEQKFGPDVSRLLREIVKPYFGADGSDLRSLHEMDRLDKHRLITPIVHNIRLATFWRIGDERPLPVIVPTDIYRPYKDGEVFFIGRRQYINCPPLNVGDELKTTFEVSFDDGGEFKFLDVYPVLCSLKEQVTRVVDLLTRFA